MLSSLSAAVHTEGEHKQTRGSGNRKTQDVNLIVEKLNSRHANKNMCALLVKLPLDI